MKYTDTAKQITSLMLAQFKGLDRDAQIELSDGRVREFVDLSLKELTLLAESARYGAGRELLQRIAEGGDVEVVFRDLTALVEYGREFAMLNDNQRGEVIRSELQDEMRHFSRIMGLDSILSGKPILNIEPREALRQCDDFARFLWLVFERRNQRGDSSYELQKIGKNPQNCLIRSTYALIEESGGVYVKVLVETMSSEDRLDTKDVKILAGLMTKYPLYQALLLFDYYLFLVRSNSLLSVVSVNERLSSEGQRVAEIVLTGGSVTLFQKEDTSFAQKVLGKVTCKGRGSLGSESTGVYTKQIVIDGKKPTIAVLLSSELSKRLEGNKLLSIVNIANKQGVINVANNLKNFCTGNKIDTSYSLCKLGGPQLREYEVSGADNLAEKLPEEVITAKSLIFEVAHLHADREPTETQYQTISARDTLLTALREKGFVGDMSSILMIDDYHVVNRLNYQLYLEKLAEKGFIPDEVVPESSPLIADIAVEILQALFVKDGGLGGLIKTQGSNVYLNINGQKVIELIEDMGGKDTIGCVLFDAAFVMYKRNREYCNNIFNNKYSEPSDVNIHQKQIEYYMTEDNPEKRLAYVRSLQNPLPTYDQLQQGAVEIQYLNSINKERGIPCVINVHEVFYRPQQAKVNALLDILGEEKINTLYIDPQSKQFIFEQSIVR